MALTPYHHCTDQESEEMSVASFVSLFQIDALTQKKRADDSLANLTRTLPVMAQVEVTVFAMAAVTGRIHPNEWTRGSPETLRSDAYAADFPPQQESKNAQPTTVKKKTTTTLSYMA